MRDATAGDPITGLKWTGRSLRRIAEALRRSGHQVGRMTVQRLLDQDGYALRANRKQLATRQSPDRDEQMQYLASVRRSFLRRKCPVISVDAKKRELIGLFKNAGRTWRTHPRVVSMYDFPSDALGVAIPYGVYDVGRDEGYVLVGTSHNTPHFAVAAITAWWNVVGRQQYPDADAVLIQADAGGSNNRNARAWRTALQTFADATGLRVTVTHYPTGASKWNFIEHRLFSRISKNWAGQPLETYETILKYLRTTRTGGGHRVRAHLDLREYPLHVTVSDEQLANVQLRRHTTLAAWNYTITPRARPAVLK